jgi:hypothetical protein
MTQTKPCPQCKEAHGWWERRQQSYKQYYVANGDPSHASDGEGVGRGGRRKYCYECNRDITDCVSDDEATP